ncbi:translation initiation factor IF-3 [bacterium]|nr:translation initiation factor IF-3 [bacterium]
MRKRSKAPPKPAPPEPRTNERIRVPEVRLIDENGAQVGVVRTSEAIAMARQRDVDLVEVAAGASPPVARLMDFGRFKYEQSKKDREAKKHQQNVQLREVRMKPKIDDHDIDFKTRTAAKLLKRGDKVKVTVTFRGREIGRHMTIIVAPDKKKMAAKARAEAAAGAPAPEEDDAELEAAVAAARLVDEDAPDDDYEDDETDEDAPAVTAGATGD